MTELSLYLDGLEEDDERVEDALEHLDNYVGRGMYEVLDDSPDSAPASGEAPYLEVESELAGKTYHSHENIEQALEALGFSDRQRPI